ncbi:DUF655 domain-containing protein [Bordetella sp. LUAb4]|uniref:ComEA family DNA-binding protein n=1 Tax=Bordetella sp. LUAb4 TaxID=2843195 RepID=UPI001E5C1177|nr:DUF655 domain-containing protein [Bordetella sp. LUAb4]
MNPFLHNPVAVSLAPEGAPVVDAAANAALAPVSASGTSAGAKALRAAWARSVRAPAAGRRTARHWGRRLGMLALAAGMSLTAASALALDVNSATAEQLQTLRGVGPKTAAIIIHERQRGGNFQSLEDLSDRVRGIGAKKARALKDAGLSIGAGAGAATGTSQPGGPAGTEPGAAGGAGAEPAKPAGRAGRQGARRGSGRS